MDDRRAAGGPEVATGPGRDDRAADQRARRVVAAMWDGDAASAGLGMRLVSAAVGSAVVEMPIRADMVNGHGIAHGGFVFSLADSAFAFACNSRNRRTVAQACDIVFMVPARLGDVLVAEATERATFGRNGIYDVTVRRDGELVAEFRGHSRQVSGTILDLPETTSPTTPPGITSTTTPPGTTGSTTPRGTMGGTAPPVSTEPGYTLDGAESRDEVHRRAGPAGSEVLP